MGEFPKSILFLACIKIQVKQRDKSKKENRIEDIEAPIIKEKRNSGLNEPRGELDCMFHRVLKKLMLKAWRVLVSSVK